MTNAPIRMRRVENETDVDNVGDFAWGSVDGVRHIFMALPSPNPNAPFDYAPVCLGVSNGNSIEAREIHQDRIWGWNGDEDQPTLTPSIHCIGHWHGWVRDGFLVEA